MAPHTAPKRSNRKIPVLRLFFPVTSDSFLEAYRREKNAVSIDGLPTGLFEDA
jgi:hypothetical protein